MSIVTISPTLSYVSSQDVQSSPSGSTNYMILFDSSNALVSNVIMFEYKFQTINELIPNLDNTSFGFVAVENAIQSGIVNQYIISVPINKNTLTGAPEDSIQVRVYYGDLSSSDIVVSEWSNELNVYLPPDTPVIYTDIVTGFQGSYYDPSSSDLFVLLNEVDNSFNFIDINFIVCFFYQDNSGQTLWKVSDPTPALPTVLGTDPFRLITVPLEGTVSTDLSYNKVYVSIHSVYDWQNGYAGNSYHSISYISNEVEAVLASEDGAPDITSVDYNVYTTPLPGDQTMTVNWIAPGNSAIPFFAVDHYELYYSLDGGASFTLVPGADDISSTTLSYLVDVGTTGLNLACGDNIVFRVNAIDVQSTDTPSAPSSDTNIFKYSEAVTNLTITNTTWDGTSIVGLTVNFDGVSDSGSPNKGCGNGIAYVVEINGSVYSGTGSLVYSSDASYSIVYSGLSIAQTGDVTVYLQTQNTNPSPPSPLDGESATVPYVAGNMVLDPVDYLVYFYELNEEQDMVLDWSDPATGSWTVDSYIVQYSIDGGANWVSQASTLLLTYTFDASTFAVSDPPTNIEFRVLANMVNGLNSYVITSNTESKYTFKYAEEVQHEIVNWAVANTDNTLMDLSVQFNNPLTTGINDGLVNFVVTVKDMSDNLLSSQTITYVSGQITPYIVYFNDILYSFEGEVTIESFVTDSNSASLLTSHNYVATVGYQTSTVPIFENVDVSGVFVTGNIYTHDQLKPTGKVFPVLDGLLEADAIAYSTLGTTPGFTINYVTLPNGTLEYTFSIDRAVFFAGITPAPSGCIIAAANNAGIGNIRKPFGGL